MKLERFKEKDKKKTGIIIFTISCLVLVAGVYFYTSFALFEQNQNFNVINGSVQDPGDIYFAFYKNGVISKSIPRKEDGYVFDTTKSSCTKGATPELDSETWNIKVLNMTESQTKCTLYFVKDTETVSTVLGNIEVKPNIPDFTKSSCSDDSCESHEKGIYETTDDDGTSYYYRGSVENNYVSFAGYYWRIIRINGNGSIRMIFDGTVAHANGESSIDRAYGTSKFNEKHIDNMYVGYMYTSGNAHGTQNSSTIKTAVDNFYQEKLSNYANYIDTESGFCGDRVTLNNATGVGNATTYYSGYSRVEKSEPNLSCSNSNDNYTVNSSSKGNKALTYPIGLITVDEVMLAGHAGGVFNGTQNNSKTNSSSYLTIGNTFWTITPVGGYIPSGDSSWYAVCFLVGSSGRIDDFSVTGSGYMRPVINLKSSVKISGRGTMNDPYVVNPD